MGPAAASREPSRLQWRVAPARALGAGLIAAWGEIQQADRSLQSPFFRPEYAQTIAAVRDDVFVAIGSEQDEPVAFFPFQRSAWMTGAPVGGPLSDYQGIVARPGVVIDARALLRACGLRSWRFDHVPVSQCCFAQGGLLEDPSRSIDLSGGLDDYLAQRRKASKNEFFQTVRKTRKIEREIGSLRLEMESRDLSLLEQLIAWKSPQYRRTHTPNIFEYRWVIDVLRRLLECRRPEFGVYFSALYVKDDLLGINLGLRCGAVYHSWMTTYNLAYATYAPGRSLLLEIVKASPERGIRLLDMGRGTEQFKNSFGNASTMLMEGIVEQYPVTRWFHRRWLQAREKVRRSRYQDAIRVPWSWVRPVRDWLKYR